MTTAVEVNPLALHDVSDIKFSPSSHLGSSFIEGLRRKYPKACNRSLTNLSTVGLSLPDHKPNKYGPPAKSLAKGDNLPPFSKGLSSSQPDLLKAAGLSFCSHTLGVDSGNPMSARTISTSGLNLLGNSVSTLPVNKAHLTPSVVHQRLRESRAKMDELANKITEISRSNNNLQDIGKSPAALSVAPSLPVNSDDDVDDSAPIVPHNHKTAVEVKGQRYHTAVEVKGQRYHTGSAGRPSANETKLKLEELRLELTKKCENLQKRRDDIFSRISSRLRDTQAIGPGSLSSPMSPNGLGTQPQQSAAVPANPTTPRKSGTDSDGDSGIDLSLKHSRLPFRNSLAPKLKKYSTNSPRTSAFDAAASKAAASAPHSLTVHLIQSKRLDYALEQSKSATVDNQHQVSLVGEFDSNLIATATSSKQTPSADNNTKLPSPAKSVRFAHTNDVIKSETPRLLQLQHLAEQSAALATVLPDTDLAELDSDSEISTSDSDCSSSDLADIDPRLVQLALGVDHSGVPNEKYAAAKQCKSSTQSIEPTPSISIESQPDNHSSDHSPSMKSLSSTNDLSKNNVNFSSSTATPSAKKISPPKPARVQTNIITENGGHSAAVSKDVQDWVDTSTAQPYSIVDASSFHHPSKSATKGKAKKNSNQANDSKPPIPKSSPPKKTHALGKSLSAENPYEDVNISPSSNRDQSLKSRRDQRDGEPSISHNERNTVDERDYRDMESSTVTLDSESRVNSIVPSQFSSTPDAVRGRAGSCNDLWGSNASIYSSNEKLASNSSLSGSRSSVFERVGSFKQAAKKKIKSLRRSLSLDRLGPSKTGNTELPPAAPLSKKSSKSPPNSNGIPPIKKSLSWRALNQLKLSKKASYSVNSAGGGDNSSNKSKKVDPKKSMVVSPVAAGHVDDPSHFRRIGKLLELCVDGCRRVQLNKPPHGPFGFYIGPSQHRTGVFVTRLSDSYAEKLFSGLLAVGDEIKEINGTPTSKLSHSNILDIISKSQKLVLKVKANTTAVSPDEWF